VASGVWFYNPALVIGITVGGILPLEELIFFGLTNVLIVFGMTLFLAIDKVLLKRLVGRPQPAGASSEN
jgi:lycopene beta-cyclase